MTFSFRTVVVALTAFPFCAAADGNNPFLFASSSGSPASISSCSAPDGLEARISGLYGFDTYVGSIAPSKTAGHVTTDGRFALFGNDQPIVLAGDNMVTQNRTVADLCKLIADGHGDDSIQAELREAISRGDLWWPVKASWDERDNTTYVSAAHVSFREPVKGDEAPLGYLHMGSREPALRILSLTGKDTVSARVVAEPVAYKHVQYCNIGHSPSALYQHLARGVPLKEPIVDGIWRGCTKDNYFAGAPGETLSLNANCPAMTFNYDGEDEWSILEFLPQLGYTSGGGIPERFMKLCPETAEAIFRDLCDSEGGGMLCEAAAELASGTYQP